MWSSELRGGPHPRGPQAVENQKFFNGLDRQPQPEDESEFVDAFVALGGKADRSGSIQLTRLVGVLEVSAICFQWGSSEVAEREEGEREKGQVGRHRSGSIQLNRLVGVLEVSSRVNTDQRR